jgi:tellurite resistance protein TehA-like permease
MKDAVESVVVFLLATGIWIVLPAVMVWGWVRWAKRTKQRTLFSILSLIGFAFATISALLAISSVLYAHVIGGFPFYDPLLLRIYRWGFLLSLSGIAFGISGIWRSSPLRWHAPACAGGKLVFWIVAAMGE